jgi:hypothetical protein
VSHNILSVGVTIFIRTQFQFLIAVLFAASGCFSVHAQQDETLQGNGVLFNDSWLESIWGNQACPNVCEALQAPSVEGFDCTDRRQVVRHVLRNCRNHPVVYPSERYFYFKFYHGHRLISGNLRFCDCEDGVVHFGYFDEHDPSFVLYGSIRSGLNGTVAYDDGKKTVKLEYSGIQRTFKLDRSWTNGSGLKKTRDEQLVSGVLDESGYSFWLVFNEIDRRLYYVLNEARLPEKFSEIKLSGTSFFVGRQSRFIFFEDKDNKRKILVGVSSKNIASNNYFDGPFDQVPPDLHIKSILELVYPYIKGNGGIDEHGNFLGMSHSRVAISPYNKYESTTQFLEFAARGLDPALSSSQTGLEFLDLVYESKMDYHRVLENYRTRALELRTQDKGGIVSQEGNSK